MVSEEVKQEEVFDINDPALHAYTPDINPDEAPEMSWAPPPDGYYKIRVRPNRKRQKDIVYLKDIVKDKTGKVISGKVIAALSVRLVDQETGEEKQFLKDYYPSTTPTGPKKGSALTFICAQAKDPITAGSSLPKIKEHVELVLAENEEQGIDLWAKIQWVKSFPRVQEFNGIYTYVYEGEYKVYDEIKGEEKIKKQAVLEAQNEVATWAPAEDEPLEDFVERTKRYIESAPDRAHIFYDVVSGKELTVSAVIQSLEDPYKLFPNYVP